MYTMGSALSPHKHQVDFITKSNRLASMKKNKTAEKSSGSPQKKRKKFRYFSLFRRLPLLLSLTRRAFIFSSCVLAAQIVLFFSGNIQNFLDENLSLILYSICFSSIGTGFFALAACAECVYYIITTKKTYFYVHLVIFIIFLILAVFVCLFSNAVQILSGGIVNVHP